MNTATTTTTTPATAYTLGGGYFARRNWLDWLFALAVAVGGLFALQRYGVHMDVYEKGILLASISAVFHSTTWARWR